MICVRTEIRPLHARTGSALRDTLEEFAQRKRDHKIVLLIQGLATVAVVAN